MKARIPFLLAVAFLVAAASGCAAKGVHRVSDLRTLQQAVGEKAEPGDVIEIKAGTYYLDTPKIEVLRSGTSDKPIIIRGVSKDGKRPVIDASKANVDRGIFTFEEATHDVILENLELSNAVGGGHPGKEFPRNAAACYILGSNITIRDCNIHHCENGLFSTQESDFLLVDGCDIGRNGSEWRPDEAQPTYNLHLSSVHQIVVGSYLHDAGGAESFRLVGANNVFAFNWSDGEDLAYCAAGDAAKEQNTLWLGNVAVKQTFTEMHRSGGGSGPGAGRGTVVALNNTFATTAAKPFYSLMDRWSTCDVILINSIIAGPGSAVVERGGRGGVTGTHNWVAKAQERIPAGGRWEVYGTIEPGYIVEWSPAAAGPLVGTVFGEDPGFIDAKSMDYRLVKGGPCIGAGVGGEEYMRAVKLVTQHSREGGKAKGSPEWLAALETIEKPAPALEPGKKAAGATARKGSGAIDIGAYGYSGQE